MLRKRFPLNVWLAVAVLLVPSVARGGWETVRVIFQEPSGETSEIEGTKIVYGYYVREFTPKGVKDRLRTEKGLAFPDRDIPFPDLTSIEFDLEADGTSGKLVPTKMRITYQEKRDQVVRVEREVGDLRGFGNPNPAVLIVTTADGRVELDLTPPFDDEGRGLYRPIVRILFD